MTTMRKMKALGSVSFRGKELENAFDERLTYRQRRILELRYGLNDYPPRTLEEVGVEFGISRERVRQIQKEALAKLKDSKHGNC